MNVTATASRRRVACLVVGSLLLCVIGLGLWIVLARQLSIDGATTNNRWEPIILIHAPAGPTERVEGWAGGMFITVEGNFEITAGANSLNLRAGPTALTGTVNGMPVSCQNLTLDPRTSKLTVDDPELFARIGRGFDMGADP